ncbi:MAG: histidine kinase, partial [Bacteroidetes bacterium HGW-Bacteroidetes-17]
SKEEINDEVIIENIGLSNIQRQLELIYPTHELSIENGNMEFIVKLKINLNDGKI